MLARDRALRPRDGREVAEHLQSFDGPSPLPAAGPSLRPAGLTSDERVLLCAVVGESGGLDTGRTLALDELENQNRTRAQIARELGGRFEPLGPGSFVALFSGRDEPNAIAERAGRAAMALSSFHHSSRK
jgi:hypothetical protein